jgi:hypothetical protein
VNTEALLAPYRSQMLDARHVELTRRLLDWSLQHAYREVEPALLAREAYVSSTYDLYCCPPGATLEENLLGAKFIVCFLKADDGPDEELASFLASPEGGSSAPTELRSCHDAWMKELLDQGLDTQGARAAFREMCTWMQVERGVDRTQLTEARYREFRRYTIAVPAYLACWTAIRALSLSERAHEALRGLIDVALELVYISNDLGSLERDEEAARRQPSGSDPNLVLLRARETGSRQEAIHQVVALHHEKARAFLRLRAELAGTEFWDDRAVRDHVEFLRCMTNGNLAATRHLMATRYPGTQALLERLPEVEPLASPA